MKGENMDKPGNFKWKHYATYVPDAESLVREVKLAESSHSAAPP